jgi:methionyl-tRNA formyltransferase
MFATLVEPIGANQTSEDIGAELAVLGAALLVAVVNDIAAGRAEEIPQDPAQATYAPRLNKSEGLIDWTRSAQSIHDRVRGLHPWPHAFTYLGGARYIILESRVEPHPSAASGPRAARPGELLQASGERLHVRCGDNSALAILQIQPEGRRPLDVREFLAGHHVQTGQVFIAANIASAP